MRESSFCIVREPEVNQPVPYGYCGPEQSIVDFYAKANKWHKEKKSQVYGKRTNRKWAVS